MYPICTIALRCVSWIGYTRSRTEQGAPTVVGAAPVLVPPGRAVWVVSPRNESLVRDEAAPVLAVVIHHEEGVRARGEPHNVHAFVHPAISSVCALQRIRFCSSIVAPALTHKVWCLQPRETGVELRSDGQSANQLFRPL